MSFSSLAFPYEVNISLKLGLGCQQAGFGVSQVYLLRFDIKGAELGPGSDSAACVIYARTWTWTQI